MANKKICYAAGCLRPLPAKASNTVALDVVIEYRNKRKERKQKVQSGHKKMMLLIYQVKIM